MVPVARSAIKAVKMAREDKINVGLFKPVTIWPFPSTRLRQLKKGERRDCWLR